MSQHVFQSWPEKPQSWAGASPFPNIFPLQKVWLRGPCALSPSPIIPTLCPCVQWSGSCKLPPPALWKKKVEKQLLWADTELRLSVSQKPKEKTSLPLLVKRVFFFQSSLPVEWVKEKLWILLFGVAVQIRLMQCTRLPMEREARRAHQTSHSDTVRAAGSYLRDEARGSLTQRLSPYYKTIAELKETHKRVRCTQMQL